MTVAGAGGRIDLPEEEARDLLERVAGGDKQAFAALYRAYEKPLFCFIQKRLNDSFESADLLHNVFLDVWRGAGRYQGRSKVSTWLFGIAFNKTMDRLRKKTPKPLGEDEKLLEEIPSEEPDAFERIDLAEEAKEVRHCLDKLSPVQKSVVELTFYQELSYAEIAEVVGSPEGTVKTRMFHAKQALKDCLARRLGTRQ